MTETATGSIDLKGFPTLVVGPMPLLFIGSTDPFAGAGHQISVNLAGSLSGTLVEVNLGTFRISRTQAVSVPMFTPPGTALVASLLLVVAWLQTRGPRSAPKVGRTKTCATSAA